MSYYNLMHAKWHNLSFSPISSVMCYMMWAPNRPIYLSSQLKPKPNLSVTDDRTKHVQTKTEMQ